MFEIRTIDGKDVPYVMDQPILWNVAVVKADYFFPDGSTIPPMYLRGFHVRLENGFIVSTQFGSYSYCHNREIDGHTFHEECYDAEMACWTVGNDHLCEWVGGDSVMGWVPAFAWKDVVLLIASLPMGDTFIPFASIRT